MSFSPSKSCSRRNRPESGLIVISITESFLIRYKSNHLIENMVTVSRKNIQEKSLFSALRIFRVTKTQTPLYPDRSRYFRTFGTTSGSAAGIPFRTRFKEYVRQWRAGHPTRHDLPVSSVRACNGTNFLPGRENRYSAIPADFRKRSYSATPISDTSRASRPSRRPVRPISRQPPRRNARSNRHR